MAKITNKKLADLILMRAVGYSNSDIAKKLGVTVKTVEYHLRNLKKQAEETSPQVVVSKIIVGAGPDYALRLTPFKYTPDEMFGKSREGKKRRS